MKEALLYEKNDVRIIEVPTPTVGPTDILLKVKAAKICPTDVRKYTLGSSDARIRSLPMNLCHEYAGEIVDVGGDVTHLKKGMRVTGYGMRGNAEYVKLNADSSNPYFKDAIQVLPPNVSFKEGAFTTPLSECIHCVVDQVDVRFDETLVVVGAGHMGMMQTNIAHWCGAAVIAVDLSDERLELAKEFGADYTINASKENVVERVKELTDGKMAARVVTPTGAVAAMEMALEVSGRRSIIVFFGLPGADDYIRVPALNTIFWDKTIRFSWLAPLTWPIALNALANNLLNVDPLISHTFKLKDLANGLERVKNKEDKVMKPVVVP